MTDRFQPPAERRVVYARVRQPAARRSGWALAGFGALGLACALLAAVTFLLLAAPVDLLRDHIVREVKAQTGRDLVVAGPVSLSLLPRLGVALRDVTLSAPPGMPGPPTLRAQSIDVELRAGALLSRQVSVQRVVLNRPVIALNVDAQGRRSWDFAGLDTGPTRLAQAGANDGPRPPMRRRTASTEQLMVALAQVLPTDVRIANGSVRYSDERTGSIEELKGLDADLAAGALAGPLEARGSATWRGEKIAVEATLTPISALLQERSARLVLKAGAASFQASYDGSVVVAAAGPALDGGVTFSTNSLAALGGPLADHEAGALSVRGRMTVSGDRIALPDLTAAIGETSARGSLTIDARAGQRPYLSGTLQVAELDLGKLLLRAGSTPAEGSPGRGGRRPGDPIDDLLRRGGAAPTPGPQVRGFTKRAGGARDWSDDAIDVGLLALADADLKLQADRVIYREFKTGAGDLSLSLKDRVARLTLEDMRLYGGRGRGVVTLDAMGTTAVQSVNLTLEGINSGPLLKDALGFEWLDGRAGIVLALAGQGVSERQMVESLNGTVDFKMLNGNIGGINLPKLVRSVEQGRLPSLDISQAEKTPFSELAATFVIANGIARNQDLRLVSQNARLTGAGTADLPRRLVDYTFNVKLSGSGKPPSEGTVVNFSNLEIPIRVEGSWDNPSFSIKGQEQLLDTIKQIGKNLKSQDVQDAIKGLLRGDPDGRVKPRDLLDKLLKKD